MQPTPEVSASSVQASDFGNFLWGAATAAYQIEGAHDKDGKGPSIWDKFSARGKIKHGHKGDQACDHYHRWQTDIEIMQSLRLQAYRFSISWPRVLPDGTLAGGVNGPGLDFYKKLCERLLKANIRPFVTLYHWDLPQALEQKGGWTNRETAGHFADYAGLLAKELGGLVNDWIVLNEPLIFTLLGYGLGHHAPGRYGVGKFLAASHHAMLAQGLAARALAAQNSAFNIGTTISTLAGHAASQKARDVLALDRQDAFFNRLYVDPVFGRDYPWITLPFLRKLERWILPDDMDTVRYPFAFLGINHYSRAVARRAWWMPYVRFRQKRPARGAERTDMGWEVHPPGLYQVLKQFGEYPEIPALYVTENGAAYPDTVAPDGSVHDAHRTRYLQDYIAQALRAKQDGVNLKGYFAWSLFDNLEWKEGYSKRFGIVHVDFATQKRTVKDSGLWYRDFIGG